MEKLTNIFILTALLFSILIGYYQYYFKVTTRTNHSFWLFIIRSLVFFLLFLLLINPSIPRKDLIIEKSTLSVLIDNSGDFIDFLELDQLTLRNTTELKAELEKLNVEFIEELNMIIIQGYRK